VSAPHQASVFGQLAETEPIKENHKVPVVRIAEILPHTNADKLEIVRTLGYQTIVKKGEFKVGDLAIFVQPDSVVPEIQQFSWLWGDAIGPIPVRRRRIKAKKLRGEWSEGLLLPITDFGLYESDSEYPSTRSDRMITKEGEDVSERLGITHYAPPEPEDLGGECERGPQYHRFPKSLKGWFYYLLRFIGIDLNGKTGGQNEKAPDNARPIYDVDALKNYKNAFELEERVLITEKIHGSNARYTFEGGKMFAGSRKLWKKSTSKCIWRKVLEQHPLIQQWCREHEGYTLYGEVCPTQDGYNYGCKPGEVRFFIFDILTPDGRWAEYSEWPDLLPEELDQYTVPVLYSGAYDERAVNLVVDGHSHVLGANHIREGVVIRPYTSRHVYGLGRLQLKVVSNEFLAKEK